MQVQDFCGFTFNGVHSSELGIIRTSDGNRYNTTLIPSFSRDTVSIPGNDGTLAWDSFYKEKEFQIKIAFDNLTEVNREKLRRLFTPKQRGWLVFDEEPYKKYEVFVKDPPQLTELCFDEEVHIGAEKMTYDKLYGLNPHPVYGRIYKGEGTINFVCYAGYAQNVWTFVDDIPVDRWRNMNEWVRASGLKWKHLYKSSSEFGNHQSEYFKPYSNTDKRYYLYNPGVCDADWTCRLMTGNSGNSPFYICLLAKNQEGEYSTSDRVIYIDENIRKEIKQGQYISYNSKTHLLEKKTVGKDKTLDLLNKYIISGDFFKIPVGESILCFNNKPYDSTSTIKPNQTAAGNPVPTFYYY